MIPYFFASPALMKKSLSVSCSIVLIGLFCLSSPQRAYAYLLVRSEELLTDQAKKRLRAIEELSELGAGFRLAAHDLEIRGGGNILGSQQHGHIASLGFDLYCQMLETAINELQGKPTVTPINPIIDLALDARFSEHYIQDTFLVCHPNGTN